MAPSLAPAGRRDEDPARGSLIWIKFGAWCIWDGEPKEFPIPDKQARAARRERQAKEIEANQNELRTSIAASKRLVDEADAMIRRHRQECDDADD